MKGLMRVIKILYNLLPAFCVTFLFMRAKFQVIIISTTLFNQKRMTDITRWKLQKVRFGTGIFMDLALTQKFSRETLPLLAQCALPLRCTLLITFN